YQGLTGSPGAKTFRFGRDAGTGNYQFIPLVEVDNGIVPGAFQVGDIGAFGTPFSTLWARAWASANSGHTWAFDTNLAAGSGDANATLHHDLTLVATFGSNGVTTLEGLVATPFTPNSGDACT